MHASGHFNIWAYLVSSLVYYFIGFVWYTPLFGKAWQKQTKVRMTGPRGEVLLPMLGQFASSLLFTLGVSMVVMVGGFHGIGGALTVGLSIAAFFVLSLNSGKLFFEAKPILFSIDAGYGAVGAVVTAIILTLWR